MAETEIKQQRSLEETPVWAVSLVCLAIILISMFIEAALQLLTKFLQSKRRNSLKQALGKIKAELMIMGFISLLLTMGEDFIMKICITKAAGNSFLPCEDLHDSNETSVSTADQIARSNAVLPLENKDLSYCERKGKISLISSDGLKQLHIFIFVLTVFHVLYCVLTMTLGVAKMRRWKFWEEETRTLDYEIANDPRRFRLTRQTSFGRRHLKFWSDQPLLLWPVCFLRQFSGSVTKADYFTLRNGFIVAHFAEGSNFDFQKFLVRAFDDDFVQVVGISLWVWIFSILFIFFSAHGFYNYFWLPFIPLLMVLAVGTKLQVIITKMCLESRKKTVVVQGSMLVKPSDNLFWFNQPHWLLHVIHFILFQNSFQLAFFAWTWYEFGLRSCFHRTTVDISLRIIMGVFVQFLCGYVTLPLYALVTQMGSDMNESVFTERITKGLKHWHSVSRQNLNLSRNRSVLSRHSSETFSEHIAKGLKSWHSLSHHGLSRNKSVSTVHSSEALAATHSRDSSLSDVKDMNSAENDQLSSLKIRNSAISEITEVVEPNSITKGAYDGEISFGTYAENEQLPSLSVANSVTAEITEEMVEHKIITGVTHDGEIFATYEGSDQLPPLTVTNPIATEITEEMAGHDFTTGGTHDGEISFRISADKDQPPLHPMTNSAETEIIEEQAEHKSIKRGKCDGEIIFGTFAEYGQPSPVSTTDSAPAKISEGLVQSKNTKRGIYNGEISFGTSWKELGNEKENEGLNLPRDGTTSDIN